MKENFAMIVSRKLVNNNVFFLVPGVVLLPFINLKIDENQGYRNQGYRESRVSF